MTDPTLRLASEFSPATYDAWRALAEAALKGAPFDKKLVTPTTDGFSIKPLYTAQDLTNESRAIHEVMAASLATSRKSLLDLEGWDIRQLHDHPDIQFTNRAMLEDLENGATSVHVVLDLAGRTGRNAMSDQAGEKGVMIYCRADVDLALNDIYTNLAPVSLDAGVATIPAAALLAAGREDDAILAFNYDPLGDLAAMGALPTDVHRALELAAEFAADVAGRFPRATALNVDTSPWYNAGASDGTEVAIALATGTAYLRALVDGGLAPHDAAKTLTFTIAVGTDFFRGIAKLRALRWTWNRVLSASGIVDAPIWINAIAAEHVLSKVDPWVNLLRTTVTSFAAGVGGSNSVICLPYNHAIGVGDPFSLRVARNTQLILQEESNLHRVLDPAGGSWFVENLTKELAEVAWSKFQAIEREGGIAQKILDGSLAEQVAAMWQSKEKRVATRLDPLTGVSEFPNIDEEAVEPEPPDLERLRREARARQTTCDAPIRGSFADLVHAAENGANLQQLYQAMYGDAGDGAQVAPLRQHRLPEDFEALRARSAQHKTATGSEPRIFLANIGRIAEHTARASFARNFFEAGGIKAVTNNGFADADAAGAAFRESGSRIAVMCGSDRQYDEFAAAFAHALKAAGATRLYLAGRPGEQMETYREAGIEAFIHVGADVLAICSSALDHLGVP